MRKITARARIMYSSTPSLSLSTTSSSALAKSVLAQFPPDAAHVVVTAVVKSVSSRLGIGVVLPGVPTGTTSTTVASTSVMESANGSSGSGLAAEAPALNNEAQITWFMEVGNLSRCDLCLASCIISCFFAGGLSWSIFAPR